MKKNKLRFRNGVYTALCKNSPRRGESATRATGIESIRDESRKDRSDVLADHQVGNVVEFRCVAIEDDQSGAVALGHQRKAGGRPHHQRGADGKEEIAG